MPAISVIIPIYNSDDYIATCIESLKRQSFGDFEAICIDDASTTNALAIAREAAAGDDRFVFIEQEQNSGPSVTRNTGMDHARGTYIAFLDSDDQYAENAFELLFTLAQENDLDLIDFCATPVYENEDIKKIWHEQIDTHTPLEGVVSGTELFTHYQKYREYHCALYLHFFRRSLLEEGPLRLIGGIIHEDEVFSPFLHIRAQRCMLIQDQLYLRSIHANSLVTSPRGIYNVSCLFTVLKELEGWLQIHAKDYDPGFVDAFALRIWELRKILAEDILRCTPEELIEFQETLDAADLAYFNVNGIQLASNLQILANRKSWKIAQAISHVAHRARGIAIKDSYF